MPCPAAARGGFLRGSLLGVEPILTPAPPPARGYTLPAPLAPRPRGLSLGTQPYTRGRCLTPFSRRPRKTKPSSGHRKTWLPEPERHTPRPTSCRSHLLPNNRQEGKYKPCATQPRVRFGGSPGISQLPLKARHPQMAFAVGNPKTQSPKEKGSGCLPKEHLWPGSSPLILSCALLSPRTDSRAASAQPLPSTTRPVSPPRLRLQRGP